MKVLSYVSGFDVSLHIGQRGYNKPYDASDDHATSANPAISFHDFSDFAEFDFKRSWTEIFSNQKLEI